jgi:hypothetical protein
MEVHLFDNTGMIPVFIKTGTGGIGLEIPALPAVRWLSEASVVGWRPWELA